MLPGLGRQHAQPPPDLSDQRLQHGFDLPSQRYGRRRPGGSELDLDSAVELRLLNGLQVGREARHYRPTGSERCREVMPARRFLRNPNPVHRNGGTNEEETPVLVRVPEVVENAQGNIRPRGTLRGMIGLLCVDGTLNVGRQEPERGRRGPQAACATSTRAGGRHVPLG
jgi:hypothetical protein